MSGRYITVTDDHTFARPDGTFTEAGKLSFGDKVLILPTPLHIFKTHDKAQVNLLDRNKFINLMRNLTVVSEKTFTSDANELETVGLLPLMSNDLEQTF